MNYLACLVDNLIKMSSIQGYISTINYEDEFDFGIAAVVTADGRGSVHTTVFLPHRENFFFYGYGSSGSTRCCVHVDTASKNIKISIGGINPDGVSNLTFYRVHLFKISV